MTTLNGISWYLIGTAALHAFFMCCELFPWSIPIALKRMIARLPENERFAKDGQQVALVATIVRNAGIYNAILAGALLYAGLHADAPLEMARVLIIGVAIAGVFGTATMKSVLTAIQALVGVIGFLLV